MTLSAGMASPLKPLLMIGNNEIANNEQKQESLNKIERCVQDITAWMRSFRLQLNETKLEVLLSFHYYDDLNRHLFNSPWVQQP